ncbi:hypothetical protein ACFL2A_03670 [Thermodesulfobacteriota bacterium]
MKRILIALFILSFSAGCMPRIYSETGKRFDKNNFDNIKVGETTQNELIASLGNPQQTGIKESGKDMWTYLFLSLEYPSKCLFKTTSPQIKHKFMRITVTFDKDKVFEKSYEMSKEPAVKDTK